MISTAFANPRIDVLPPPPPAPAPSASVDLNDSSLEAIEASRSALARRSVGIDLPPAVDWILGGVLALAVLSVFGGLIWMLVKERVAQRQIEMEEAEEPPTEQETERTVRAAVDAGLAALDDADTDARRAVIACWVRLEAAAAAAGTERSAGDTSTELVSRLPARHDVSEPVLEALAEVYREARFARHAVDESTREQARTALRLLRDELRAGVRRGD